jgi:hypothetical protein
VVIPLWNVTFLSVCVPSHTDRLKCDGDVLTDTPEREVEGPRARARENVTLRRRAAWAIRDARGRLAATVSYSTRQKKSAADELMYTISGVTRAIG